MSNMYEQWGIKLGNSCDINEALSEMEMKITGQNYGVSIFSGEGSEVLQAVSASLKNSVEAFPSNSQGSALTHSGENPEASSAAASPDGSVDTAFDKSDLIRTLRNFKADSDFMDISRVALEGNEDNIYQLPPIFNCDDVDIDSFDCVSIKISESDWNQEKPAADWANIFAEIERIAQDPFAQDDIYDIEYKPIRAGITLVKGKGFFPSKVQVGASEQNHAESRNAATLDNAQLPVDIPVKLYMKNGELFLKANLSRVDPGDLQRMSGLANMKSVLSLIPR